MGLIPLPKPRRNPYKALKSQGRADDAQRRDHPQNQ